MSQELTAARLDKVEADLLMLKWMVGVALAGVVSLIMRSFFT